MTERQVEEGTIEKRYVPKTNEEIKEIAMGIYKGEIFSTLHLRESEWHMAGNIFMPLIFMNDVHAKQMQVDNIAHYFEYMSKAGPRSINGYPCFFSCHQLDLDDTKKVHEVYKKIKEAMDKI